MVWYWKRYVPKPTKLEEIMILPFFPEKKITDELKISKINCLIIETEATDDLFTGGLDF